MDDAFARNLLAEQLLNSELRFRILAENLFEGVLTLDQSGKIIYANPACEKIFGYKEPEMIGRPFSMLLPESLRDNHDRNFEEYLQTGIRPFDWDGAETPCLRKDGRLVSALTTFREIADRGQINLICIVRALSSHENQSRKILISTLH